MLHYSWPCHLNPSSLSPLSHESNRYVLKNKDTDEIFFVVVFALVPRENASDSSSDADSSDSEAEAGEKAEGREPEKENRKGGNLVDKMITAQVIQKDPKMPKSTIEEGSREFETSPSDLD